MANAQAGRNLDILELARLTVPIRINQGGHGSTDAKQGLTNLIVNADGVPFKDTNYSGTLKQDTLTANRTWTLPDESGTIALTSLCPAGAVMHFAMDTAPSGWLECDGSAVSRTTYATLFAAIGTTFGTGDGSTTFDLPDLRGEFIRGWDDGRGVDDSRTFGSSQTDALKTHSHTYTGFAFGTGATELAAGTSFFAGNTTGNNTGNSSPASTETRPRNVALLPCIKT